MSHTDEPTHNHSQRRLPQSGPRLKTATEPAWIHDLAQGLDALRHANFRSSEDLGIEGWHSESEYRPALGVGGDFYDIIPLAGDRFGVLIGDVAGKGEPAARVMAYVRAVLRAEAETDSAPAAVLRTVNDALVAALPAGIFVTCFYMVVHAQTGYARFANAGHTLPLKAYGNDLQRLDATGFPLGLVPEVEYAEAETWLEQGSTLFLYSDGITEAHNSAREMFGFARMHEVAATYGRQRAQRTVLHANTALLHMLAALEVFTDGTYEQEDDITLLVLHRL